MGRASQKSVKRSGGGYLRLSTDRETKGPGSWNEDGYLRLSSHSTARTTRLILARSQRWPSFLARRLPRATAAVPAAAEPVAETAPERPPARRCSGLPRGVGLVKKSGKYQGRVYDSLDTKKQRGIGCFSTPEQAGAAVDAAEAALKQGISPWAGPRLGCTINNHLFATGC